MRCCEEERTTPFCPQCGAKLRVACPLDALLAYLRVQLAKMDANVNKWERECAKDAEDDYSREKLKRTMILAEKWHTWARELEALMATRGVEDCPPSNDKLAKLAAKHKPPADQQGEVGLR